MTGREKAELAASVLWFLMDGFWMLEWLLPAKACFAGGIAIVLWFSLSPIRLRRLRLPR